MPLPKGAKMDPKTGKYKMPAGHRKKHSNDGQAPKSAPVSRSQRIERQNDLVRMTARQNFAYCLFAQYPSGRAYVGQIEEPSFESIGATWGGGRFEVWKMDRTSGEYVGDPVVYPIDPLVFPPKLQGFAAVQRGPLAGAPGQFNMPGMQGQGYPGPMPGLPPAPDAAKLEELEEEIEDLEEENTTLKARLATVERERESERRDHERELADLRRKEEFRAMVAELKGTGKDPLEMLLNFKRVDAELAGPLKLNQDPMAAMQANIASLTMMLDLAKKLGGNGDKNEGGGMDGLLQLAGKFIEAKQAEPAQVIQLPAAPTAKPAAPAGPTPEEVAAAEAAAKAEAGAVMEVFTALSEEVRQLWASAHESQEDPLPERLTEIILTRPGWDKFRAIVRIDNPENALQVFLDSAPDTVPNEERQKWIVSAFALAQAQLLRS